MTINRNTKLEYYTIAQVLNVVNAIGYNASMRRFIWNEFKKNNKARACKKCKRKIYAVALENYINELPRNKFICQECAGLKDDFKPKLERKDAWLV